MKKIILKNMELNNFKAIEHLKTDFYEDITDIRGDNGTGKTTIADALFWLLFDKPYTPNTEFNVKPYDENGHEIHNLETSAEITLGIDGDDTVLKKILTEKWISKKGEEEKTLKGNETLFFIDEVPVSPTQFKFFMEEEFKSPDILRTLINPSLFSEETHWKDKRNILLNLAGTSDEWDTVRNNPDFAELLPYEKKYSLNELYLKSEAEIKVKNKEKTEKTAEINTLSGLIKDTGDDKDTLSEELKTLNLKSDELKKELNKGKGDLKKEELKKELNAMNEEYLIKSREDTEKINVRAGKLNEEILRKNSEISEENISLNSVLNKIKENKSLIEKMSALNKKALIAYKENEDKEKNIKLKKFSEKDTLCPTCGTPFSKEKAEEIKRNFNLKRAEDLKNTKLFRETAVKEGKERSLEIKRLQAENKTLTEDTEKAHKNLEKYAGEKEELLKTLQKIKSAINPETTKLKSRITEKEEEIRLFKFSDKNTEEYEEELLKVTEKIKDVSKKIYDIESGEELRKKSDEKKKELADLRNSILMSEKISYLSKEAEKEMIKSLEDKINEKFDTVSFRLFETALSGSVKEICQAYIERNGTLIPLNASNDASKVQGGIEIINVLSDYYGLNAPLIIDRRGEVRSIPETSSQIINLYVSGDSQLKITKG